MPKAANQYCKDWYAKNKEKEAARKAKWRKDNPEQASNRATRWALKNPGRVENARLKRKYGIDLETYHKMIAEQRGLCAICAKIETCISKKGKVKGLSVDHDHKTGIVRGLLCSACNQSLGGFKDNPNVLENAAKYLRKYVGN